MWLFDVVIIRKETINNKRYVVLKYCKKDLTIFLIYVFNVLIYKLDEHKLQSLYFALLTIKNSELLIASSCEIKSLFL
jgi:hypothetical protein